MLPRFIRYTTTSFLSLSLSVYSFAMRILLFFSLLLRFISFTCFFFLRLFFMEKAMRKFLERNYNLWRIICVRTPDPERGDGNFL